MLKVTEILPFPFCLFVPFLLIFCFCLFIWDRGGGRANRNPELSTSGTSDPCTLIFPIAINPSLQLFKPACYQTSQPKTIPPSSAWKGRGYYGHEAPRRQTSSWGARSTCACDTTADSIALRPSNRLPSQEPLRGRKPQFVLEPARRIDRVRRLRRRNGTSTAENHRLGWSRKRSGFWENSGPRGDVSTGRN